MKRIPKVLRAVNMPGFKPPKKPVVAIYARVSTSDQSPGLQLRELRTFAKRRGFTIAREYMDQVTGDVATRVRGNREQLVLTTAKGRTILNPRRRRRRDQGYIDLMNDAVHKKFDCVIVWKFDRFARSLAALVEALQTFAALGIEFISITEAIDTTTPQGRLFFHIVGSFAEFEREMIVERVRAGIANARAKGTQLGRPRDLAIENKVRKLAAKGLSLSAIARQVKRSRTGVRKILQRVTHARKGAA